MFHHTLTLDAEHIALIESGAADGVLKRSNGPLTADIQKIFIREHYKKLAQLLCNLAYQNIILTGTPGVGKSYFAVYFVNFLLKTDTNYKSIQFRQHSQHGIVYFAFEKQEQGGVWQRAAKKVPQPDIYVNDDSESTVYSVATRKNIFISSPRVRRIRVFNHFPSISFVHLTSSFPFFVARRAFSPHFERAGLQFDYAAVES